MKYSEDDYNFLIGYNFLTDKAYVYTYAETSNLKSSVTISEDKAEDWGKLIDFIKN